MCILLYQFGKVINQKVLIREKTMSLRYIFQLVLVICAISITDNLEASDIITLHGKTESMKSMDTSISKRGSPWIKITDFEQDEPLSDWTKLDLQNETQPRIANPQVTEVLFESKTKNHYLLKKPAADGIVGNRKAITYFPLPQPMLVGEIYTFYLRLNVAEFPNNHVFGLSDMGPEGIAKNAYNALEPSLRITDRYDPNIAYKNDGTLLVRKDEWYDRINNPHTKTYAGPMQTNIWYHVWIVVNNQLKASGGQTYDVYIQGGDEFPEQQKVYSLADFRMQREQALIYFSATCNTGPKEKPYGNGGLKYDDLYMASGRVLEIPK